MQRTYDGSLDMRISMSFARLALNWVAAWRGRHEETRQRMDVGEDGRMKVESEGSEMCMFPNRSLEAEMMS